MANGLSIPSVPVFITSSDCLHILPGKEWLGELAGRISNAVANLFTQIRAVSRVSMLPSMTLKYNVSSDCLFHFSIILLYFPFHEYK